MFACLYVYMCMRIERTACSYVHVYMCMHIWYSRLVRWSRMPRSYIQQHRPNNTSYPLTHEASLHCYSPQALHVSLCIWSCTTCNQLKKTIHLIGAVKLRGHMCWNAAYCCCLGCRSDVKICMMMWCNQVLKNFGCESSDHESWLLGLSEGWEHLVLWYSCGR